MGKIISAGLAVFLVIAGIYAWYLGIFRPVNIGVAQLGPWHSLEVKKQGPYTELGQVLTSWEKTMRAKNLNATKIMVVYLDDPLKVKQNELKMLIYFILREKPDLIPTDSNYVLLPATKYIVAAFNYNTELSIPIAVYKTRSEMKKRVIKKENRPYQIEVYEKSLFRLLRPL